MIGRSLSPAILLIISIILSSLFIGYVESIAKRGLHLAAERVQESLPSEQKSRMKSVMQILWIAWGFKSLIGLVTMIYAIICVLLKLSKDY